MAASHSIQSNIPAFRLVLLHPRYWLSWLGIVMLFIIAWLPLFVTSFLSHVLGVHVAAKNKKRYHIARVNLKLCYPDKSEAEIDSMLQVHFVEQVRAMLYYARLWFYPEFMLRRMILLEGIEQVEEYRKQNRNIIFLLSHSVGLDVSIASIAMRYKSNGPYKAMRNPVFDWLIANRRLRYGGRVFTREDGLRPIIRTTRAGSSLVYLADEDLGSDSSIFAPLFGVQKATIPVLGRLAKSCNATVLPCICCYDKKLKKYKTTVLAPMDEMTGDDAVDALTMNQAIEKTIAVCPPQYFWTFRLFQTRPPGEKSLYE